MRHTILAACLSAALLSGCGGDDDGGAAAPQPTAMATASMGSSAPTDTIRIEDFLYDPTPATVRAGQKVSVVNDDAAPHTLTDRPTSGMPTFDTANITGDQTGSFVAPKAGTYAYYCELHAFMKGRLTVVP